MSKEPLKTESGDGSRGATMDATATRPSELRALAVLVIALGGLSVATTRSLLAPVIVAAWFAGLTWPIVSRLARRFGGRPRVAGAATVVMVLLIVAPLVIVAVPLWSMIAGLFDQLLRAPRVGALRQLLLESPHAAGVPPASGMQRLIELGRQIAPTAASVVAGAFTALSGIVAQLFVLAMSAYYFAAEGDVMMDHIRQGSPLAPSHLRRLAADFMDVARGILVGGLLTCAAQGVIATALYTVLGVPRALLFGVLTGVGSAVPVLGSALVWLPLCGLLVSAGRLRDAAILAACGVLVISTVDNLLRPFLTRFGTKELHPLLLVLGIFGGIQAFGAWGIILGPLSLSLFVTAYRLYADEVRRVRASGPPR